MLERVKQITSQITGYPIDVHPLDPLSASEIQNAVAIVNKEHKGLFYNAVTLLEPRKAEMLAWLASPETAPRPHRVADVVAIGRGSKVYDGLVNLDEGKIESWELTDGVQPLVRSLHSALLTELTRIRSPWRTSIRLKQWYARILKS